MKTGSNQKLALLEWVYQVSFHKFGFVEPFFGEASTEGVAIPKCLIACVLTQGCGEDGRGKEVEKEIKAEIGLHDFGPMLPISPKNPW